LYKTPQRGDVIVFRKPGDESIDYIKRLVALPNDTVQVKEGVLYINSKKANRVKTNIGIMKNIFGDEKVFTQYNEVFEGSKTHKIIEASDNDTFDDTILFKVPPNHFFFMGDNRDNSRDSRTPEVGFVPKKNLIGKAEIIFFSHDSSASIFQFWKWHKAIRFSRIGKSIE
jgi:signal peptidase I